MKVFRVVVVDDSAFSRRTITKMLEGIKGVEVVGFATDGEVGIQKVAALKPDLVTIDLEMPKMDGFTLLRILTTRFSVPVIIISALNSADKVFKALELGALDFVAKPCSNASTDLLQIREDLEQKVFQILNHTPNEMRRVISAQPANASITLPVNADNAPDIQQSVIDLVAIGASTGGPPALQSIFSMFKRKYPFAVVVSQHMPSGFTKAFADRLNRSSAFDIKEAEDGDLVSPGQVLITPGGKNMIFEVRGGLVTARIIPATSIDRYVPSVDVMFESCAGIYKNRMIAVVLTGMGNDGSRGLRTVHGQGGYIIAESNETAIVYGMPREAVATGLVNKITPLNGIAGEILIKANFAA